MHPRILIPNTVGPTVFVDHSGSTYGYSVFGGYGAVLNDAPFARASQTPLLEIISSPAFDLRVTVSDSTLLQSYFTAIFIRGQANGPQLFTASSATFTHSGGGGFSQWTWGAGAARAISIIDNGSNVPVLVT